MERVGIRKQALIMSLILALFILPLLSPLVHADVLSIQWYNPINSTLDLSINPLGETEATTDTILYKQGAGSVHLVMPTGSGNVYFGNHSLVPLTLSYPPYPSTFGIYMKFVTFPNYVLNWANGTDDMAYAGFYNNGTYLIDEYESSTKDIQVSTNISIASLGTSWHWYEISVVAVCPPHLIFYIDGVNVGETVSDTSEHWVLDTMSNTETYFSTPSNYWVDYARIYKGEEYPPYLVGSTATSGGIDIPSIPVDLASATGLPIAVCGILATLILGLFVELIVLVFASDNILILTMVGLLIISIGVALTWIPLITLIAPVFVVAFLSADVFRKWITGQH